MKTLIALLFVVFGLVSVLVYKFGLQPKAVPVIKWSQLDSTSEWAEAVVSRAGEVFKNEKTILIGVDPNSSVHAELVAEIVKAFEAKGFKFDVVAVDARLNLGEQFKTPNTFDFSKPLELITAGVKEAEQRNLHTLLVAPSINVSHVIKEHGIHDLEAALGAKPLASIALADYPLTAEQEPNMTWKCVADHVDTSGASDFACYVLYAARGMYAKKHDAAKEFAGWMERTGERDFVVFFKRSRETKAF